ncbi:outer membrane protein [Pontibacter ramchanderi]|uniref:Opacity protein-like surface antigen n=1 Tax=Pontibacter ramchanderi TaxID=1179743 RepID=A0A2N3UCL8_9BACT|nr:outer membrane beta-barrel protein [Pontibacter ramchanderi]PKV67138.1 opacity protein-like surface antigen [Pontibacter ramchanderi]
MKKILLILAFGLSLAGSVQAQDSVQVKTQVSAPYKLAVGMRYASGPAGVALGLTAKYFIREQAALEAYSDLNPSSRHFLASLSYVWQPKLATSGRLRPYAGIGIGMLRTNNPAPMYFDGPDSYTNLVGVASFGVEYTMKKIPLAISLDYRSAFVRYGRSTPPYVHLNNSNTIGLGLKYTFR